jgi:hypothetical protein
MSKMVRYLLIMLLAAVALPGAAQSGGHPGDHLSAGERNAFQMLLDRRTELSLSQEQARRLQEIGRRLETVNGPLRERLRAERQRFLAERRAQLERMSEEERRLERERMRQHGPPPLPPGMQAITREMRQNIRVAMQEAHGVLTPPQRQRVRRMLHEARERRGEGRRGLPGRRHRRGQP